MVNLLVTPYSGERAVLALDDFERLQQEYVATHPLVFKVDSLYIPVYGETSVPSQTLALPNCVWEELDMGDPTEREVFLAKKHTVERIVRSLERLENAVTS